MIVLLKEKIFVEVWNRAHTCKGRTWWTWSFNNRLNLDVSYRARDDLNKAENVCNSEEAKIIKLQKNALFLNEAEECVKGLGVFLKKTEKDRVCSGKRSGQLKRQRKRNEQKSASTKKSRFCETFIILPDAKSHSFLRIPSWVTQKLGIWPSTRSLMDYGFNCRFGTWLTIRANSNGCINVSAVRSCIRLLYKPCSS